MSDNNIIKSTFEYGDGMNLRCTYRASSINISIEDFTKSDVGTTVEIFLDVQSAEKLAHWLLSIRELSD